MSKQESINRLNGRDFINIGIYTAIYFIIVMVLVRVQLLSVPMVREKPHFWNQCAVSERMTISWC